MKLKNYAYRCVAVICAIVAVSCVDRDFSIRDVSTEVSVFEGKTVLPVASVEKIYLGDLLGSEEDLPEWVVRNEDGSYMIYKELPEDSFAPEGFELPTSFEIPEIGSSFEVALPSLDFGSYSTKVDENFGLNLSGAVFDLLSGAQEFTLTQEYLTWMNMSGVDTSVDAHIEETVSVDAVELTLPEQITNVSTVYFKSIEEGHKGAPLHIKLNLNGLSEVNGGGMFTFLLNPVATDLIIRDSDNNLLSRDDNHGGAYFKEVRIEAGQSVVDFALYIEGLTNTNEPKEGNISIDPSMAFDISFHLDAQAGVMRAEAPTVTVYSEFALEDADVCFNSNIDLVNFEFGENGSEGFGFELEALPKEIKSINRIALDDNSVLRLYADGFEWLKDSSDCVSIDMTLPDCLVLRPIGGTYQYDEENHMLTMTIGDISEGLEIAIEAIDFGENGLSSVEGEPISIDFNPAVRVHFTQPCDENGQPIPIGIKSFIPEEPMNLSVGLRPTTLGFESVSAEINFEQSLPLDSFPVADEFGDDILSGLELNGLGISPILEVMVTNPLTIEANIAAKIIPTFDGEASEENAIVFKATIQKATYDELTGEVTPTPTRIVLAKEEYREEYPESEGYTFVECNLDNLFKETLPDSIQLEATVALPHEVITLHLTDNLSFSYGGSFKLPIAFDEELSIAYEHKENILENGESPLAEIAAIEGIKVGDIALIAEFESTIPLELAVTTTLYNKDEEVLPTKIGFVEGSNTIEGSEDGVTPVKKPMRLLFDLADESGSLAELKEIAMIGLRIEARSAVEEGVAPLMDEQYIAAEIKLEIDGGVTVDLGKLLNKVENKVEDTLDELE